jgi:hypothetical protein
MRRRFLTVVSKRIAAYLQSEIGFVDDPGGEKAAAAKQ